MTTQRQGDLARLIPHRLRDGIGTHHGAAVDLPEPVFVQARLKFAQSASHEVFALGSDHAHVLVSGLEIKDVGNGHHANVGPTAA